MKKLFNQIHLANYEFILNIRLFFVNIVICGLLISVLLSVIGLAVNIPQEIQHELLNKEIGEIQISNIDYEDLDYILRFPIKIFAVGYDMDWSMFEKALDAKQKSINRDNEVDNSLNFAYFADGNSATVTEVNANLVAGEKWTEEDDDIQQANPIWLDEMFAKKMHLEVNDSVVLSNDDCRVECYVKGIFFDETDELAASYISVKLYGKLLCEEDNGIVIYARADSSPFQFLTTIHSLKENYFIVDSYEENMYAMFLLIAFIDICACILVFVTINVMIDFNNIYYFLRQRFWAINKALGMEDFDRKVICCILFCFVFINSYLMGMIFSKQLSAYFNQYINQLFDFQNLKLDLNMVQVFIVFLCVLLIGVIVLWKKKININEDIKG